MTSLKSGKKYYEENFYFADPSLLTIFTFPFIKGDASTALSSPSSIVITKKMALKYFGHQDPLGKTIEEGEDKAVLGFP